MRMFAWVVLLFWLVFGALATDAHAQDRSVLGDELGREFDARSFSADETRMLQIGLTVEGDYLELIDGRWGEGSQRALETFAARIDDAARNERLARNRHVIMLAVYASSFVGQHDLGYRSPTTWSHRLLAPAGFFKPEPNSALSDLTLETDDVRIGIKRSGLTHALAIHESFAGMREPAYTVRKENRLVTGFTGGPYLRSDLLDGAWTTTMVISSNPQLVDVIAASITVDQTASLNVRSGRIHDLMMATAQPETPEAAPEVTPPGTPAAAPAPAGESEPSSSGTAFFVNNSDLVSAKHVVEGCGRISFTDGSPVEVVALHPTLDLALLSSPTRSRHWIAVHQTGIAQLGQRVIALGYPFYGAVTTALNSTGGNVSALVGLGDDRRQVTITAPIHPGNSGGPLLARDGTVIGVVVATLDKIAVAEATGSIPENTNYAVTGSELLAFLEAEGTSLPRQDAAPADFDNGIPEDMQRAVVPVLCHRISLAGAE